MNWQDILKDAKLDSAQDTISAKPDMVDDNCLRKIKNLEKELKRLYKQYDSHENNRFFSTNNLSEKTACEAIKKYKKVISGITFGSVNFIKESNLVHYDFYTGNVISGDVHKGTVRFQYRSLENNDDFVQILMIVFGSDGIIHEFVEKARQIHKEVLG